MKRGFGSWMTASFLAIVAMTAGPARADLLVEDFEGAFPAWESGWLGTHSNLQNYYVSVGGSNDTRGNNPDGLWLSDSDGMDWEDQSVDIVFDPAFAATLTSLSIDVAGYVPGQLLIYDASGGILLDEALTLTYGAFSDPGVYATYSIASSNGISGFTFLPTGGAQIEGNTSIDNVSVTTANAIGAVPEPASMAMLGMGGLGLIGYLRRRQATA